MEVKETVAEVKNIAQTLVSDMESIKGRVDALDDLKLDNMINDMTTKLEEIQEESQKAYAESQRMFMGNTSQAEDYAEKSKEALNLYMKTGELPEGFSKGQEGIEIRAMNTQDDPNGGYLVRPELADFVIQRSFETSPLRRVANIKTISTKSVDVLIDDNEADARWIDEGASGGETDTPEVGQLTITAHKIEAEPKVSIEELQDAYMNVEAWLQNNVADKFGRKENTAFVVGNGVVRPRGFLDYGAATDADTYERGKIGQFNLGATSFGTQVTGDGLIELQGLLHEMYQPNAKWGMHRTSYSKILKTKATNSTYDFARELLKDGVSVATLLGKEVIFMADMPTEASDALAVVYADFNKSYTIVDRVGLTVLKDPYTSKGFQKFYTTKRVGGDVTSYDAIKIGKLAV